MNHFLSIFLDKQSALPIYQQLGDALLKLIEDGVIPPDSKLPPIRKMSEGLKINATTVVNAYKYLENKHAVYSVTGSGTYAAPFRPEAVVPVPPAHQRAFAPPQNQPYAINLAAVLPSPDNFPKDEFNQIFNEVLQRDGGHCFFADNPRGYEPLIEAINQTILYQTLGIRTNAQNIFITSGFIQSLQWIAQTLVHQGDSVIIENPSNSAIAGLFAGRGAQIIQMPLQCESLDMAVLESYIKLYRPRLLYIAPYFQNPTGTSMSLNAKKRLLALSNTYHFYIVEEDRFSDFNYSGHKTVPLKALDYKNRVFYLKEISNACAPGLGLSLCVIPPKWTDTILNACKTPCVAGQAFLMRAMALFINAMPWENRLVQIIGHYQPRYTALTSALDQYTGHVLSYNPPMGGLHIWLKLHPCVSITAKELADKLIQKGVLITPGTLFSLTPEHPCDDYLRIGYAQANEDAIAKGIKIIGETLSE